MKITVAKMHGAGNDFVVVAQPPPRPPVDERWVVAVADRRRGVGADGVLFLELLAPGESAGPLFRMHFYNADGGRVQLCLNGARCVALRAVQLGWATAAPFSFLTEQQVIEAEVTDLGENSATVRLALEAPAGAAEEWALPEGSPVDSGWYVDTGDPHLVLDVAASELEEGFVERARRLRHWREHLPQGANVHFVHRRSARDWSIRSFERGVEDETQACGSGCLAAVRALDPSAPSSTRLHTAFGDTISLTPPAAPGARWLLEGPAVCGFVCDWPAPEPQG